MTLFGEKTHKSMNSGEIDYEKRAMSSEEQHWILLSRRNNFVSVFKQLTIEAAFLMRRYFECRNREFIMKEWTYEPSREKTNIVDSA